MDNRAHAVDYAPVSDMALDTPVLPDTILPLPAQAVQAAEPTHPAQPSVSIIVIAFNNRHYIDACLQSLCAQAYDNYEIIVVDNASSDGSADYVEAHYPTVRLIRSAANLGFGGGNNLGARHATGDYLVFINMDTVVHQHWLTPLVQTLQDNPDIGMATSKILLLDSPDRINTCGNTIHIAGFGYLRGWMAPSDSFNRASDVPSVSGAAFVMPTALFRQLDGFDEAFNPAYVEDTDLSWRVRLLGYRIRYVPQSLVYHDYGARFNASKFFMLERNRYQMIFKNLHWQTVLLLLPALLLSEIVSWGFAAINGPQHWRAKLGTYAWLIGHVPGLLRRRRVVQRQRLVSDRDILRYCSLRLAFGQTGAGTISRVAQMLFDPLFLLLYQVYWALSSILRG